MTELKNGNPTGGRSYPRSLIPCRVVPGMFRGEWLVLIDSVDPKSPEKPLEVQMFADERDVVRLDGTPTREQPARGWVRVYQAGMENGLALILLPQFAQPVGTYLLIDKERVEQESGS
jgi:hypothetical protein